MVMLLESLVLRTKGSDFFVWLIRRFTVIGNFAAASFRMVGLRQSLVLRTKVSDFGNVNLKAQAATKFIRSNRSADFTTGRRLCSCFR